MRKRTSVFCLFFLMLFSSFPSFAASSTKDIEKAASQISNEPAIGSIQEAMKEFSHLSKSEKRSRMKELKKAIRDYKEQKKAGADINTNTLLLVLISIFIPPLAVYLHEGTINNRFWISVLLTILGYLLFGFAGIFFLGSLPGIIYALIVVLGG